MRWAERHGRLERDTDDLRRRIEGRTGSLGRRFDRICRLLDRRGYLAQDETTPAGRQLARIWSESDLVIAECLRAGIWDALNPAELAAVVSVLVYEPRRDEQPVERMPSVAVRDALATSVRIWARVVEDEEELGLTPSREPQPGLVGAIYRWARGDRLDAALEAAAQQRRGAVRRGLRALVQAGARPARSAVRRPGTRRRTGAARRHRARSGGGRAARSRGTEHAAVSGAALGPSATRCPNGY